MTRDDSRRPRSAESLATELLARDNPAERSSARLAMRADALQHRLDGRQYQSVGKFADAIANSAAVHY